MSNQSAGSTEASAAVSTSTGAAASGYWSSLEARDASPAHAERQRREFTAEERSEMERAQAEGMGRRRFLGVASATVAAASGALSGCIRKPYEKIIPYTRRPEDLIPGRPNRYATALVSGSNVLGVLVESHDGRPTKIEGNPNHPVNGDGSMGTTDAFTQAMVLDLYSAARSTKVFHNGEETAGREWRRALDSLGSEARASRGRGLALVFEHLPSPTLERLLAELPEAALYRHDPAYPEAREQAMTLLGQPGAHPHYAPDKADVLVSIGSDLLGRDTDSQRNARLFGKRRKADVDAERMSRMYAVEAAFTPTGMAADNRLQVKPSQVAAFVGALAKALADQGVRIDGAQAAIDAIGAAGGADFGKWPAEVAKDLEAARGRSLVVVGERQPAAAQALGHAINVALGNVGQTVRYTAAPARGPRYQGTAELVEALNAGRVNTVLVFGANPVFTSPGELKFGEAFAKAGLRVHIGAQRDETGRASTWHVPIAHPLETWSDLRATDGSVSVVQPLIAPLYEDASNPLDVVAALAGKGGVKAHELVRETWQSTLSRDFEKSWRRALHQGLIPNTRAEASEPRPDFAAIAAAAPQPGAGVEVITPLDHKLLDGRFANNPWLQELPCPVTKLVWDNAAWLSPQMAKSLGVEGGDLITVSARGVSLELPAWPTPGVAADTVVIPLGYGRSEAGPYADEGRGFDAYPLASAGGAWVAGATVAKASGSYPLACTQDHGTMMGRPIVREADFGDYKREPNFVEKYEVMPADKIKSLSAEPPRNEKYKQQWGMSIDLQTCVACNACTIACQAENNIPVVGKEDCMNGREMHWIRLDRYFVGDLDNPRAVTQPVGCAHCETAPCETVCPVAATVHSPEGMNDMAYNRCIGTRYCANNCPFKVRRFNFFNYQKRMDEHVPLVRLQRNPDVTVRFRGVMEKCTYCVQRVQEARIRYKRDGVDVIPDGQVTPACAQVCPSQAITFGDIDDPNSRVSKEKASPRNYAMLRELNLRPRTTYLARINNPNPELV